MRSNVLLLPLPVIEKSGWFRRKKIQSDNPGRFFPFIRNKIAYFAFDAE